MGGGKGGGGKGVIYDELIFSPCNERLSLFVV